MRAIVLTPAPAADYLLQEVHTPQPRAGEVLIKVAYAGVNRADLFQLQGKYPRPSGSVAVPGLEVSGEVVVCGEGVTGWKQGDKVCALLSEGAFADYVCAPAGQVLPVPPGLALAQAAALPEACFTAWISFVWQAQLKAGETVLIHGGASGIGTIAIQIAKALGARVFATAGTPEKVAACAALGAEAINYREQDFVQVVREATAGKGVDVILDMVGGDYMSRNFEALAQGGRLCLIAFLKGSRMEINLSPILLKRLHVSGSTLRSRSLQEKAKIADELHASVWSRFIDEDGFKPMIAHIFPLEEAKKALMMLDKGLNIGKLLLKM